MFEDFLQEVAKLKMDTRHSLNHLFAGPTGINPYARNNHPVRAQMFAGSHSNQMLPIRGREPQWIQTGIIGEYGKYTVGVKMPEDGVIIAVIDKIARHHLGISGPKLNPYTTVIYEDKRSGGVGCFNIPYTHSADQHFGFTYRRTKNLNEIYVGATIQKDTPFLETPSKLDNGEWCPGRQLNVAFMTCPEVADDGILISTQVLDEYSRYETIEDRVAEWGSGTYAKNLYGTLDEYKPHPEVGDYIDRSGLLMAFAPTDDPLMSIITQNIHSARNVDYTFDRLLYTTPGVGRVVNVKYHGATGQYNTAKDHYDKMPQRYLGYENEYHRKVLEVYHSLKRKQRQPKLKPEFICLVKNAIVLTGNGKETANLLYRDVPIDHYRVEITIAYEHASSIGSKFTNIHGGKGTCVANAPPEAMPVDQYGNRADIVVDPNTIPNRANPGVLYEQYLNSSLLYMKQCLRNMFGLNPHEENEQVHCDAVEMSNGFLITQGHKYVRDYLAITRPQSVEWLDAAIRQGLWSEKKTVIEYMKRSTGFLLEYDRKRESVEEIKAIRGSVYNPPKDRVWVTNPDGSVELSVEKIRIGPIYYVLLEKTGKNEFSAVSSAKLQHFGVPGPVTKSDKHTHPHSLQPGRVLAEAEMRNAVAYAMEAFAAEVIDRNGSPNTHRIMLEGIYNAPLPTNIHNLVSRTTHPYGGARPLAIMKHLLGCGGVGFEYESYNG